MDPDGAQVCALKVILCYTVRSPDESMREQSHGVGIFLAQFSLILTFGANLNELAYQYIHQANPTSSTTPASIPCAWQC